jgi:hypothetical protein
MASKWFHQRERQPIHGPFTAKRLKAMAASGQILPTDSVQRQGGTMMVTARRVKRLFPPQTG